MNTCGDDILHRVFSRMAASCLGCSSSVCWHWHNIIEENPQLWEEAYSKTRVASGGSDDVNKFKSSDSTKQSRRDLVKSWKSSAISEEQRLRFAGGTVTLQKWRAHSERVTCCGILMDRVATGSSDRTVRIWSVRSQKSVEEYTAPCGGSIVDLGLFETRVVAATGTDVCIWSRDDKGRLLKRMNTPNQRFHSMSVSDPELVVGCADGTSRIFDMYSGRCSRIFRQHSGPVTCLGTDSSCPQLLASGSNSGKVILCDVLTGQQGAALTPDPLRAGITCLQITPGRYLVCGTTAGTAYCWDLRNQKELWTTRISPTQVTSMHQQAYGVSVIVAGGVDGVLRVLDCATGELLQSYKPTQFAEPIRLATTKSTERASCRIQDSPAGADIVGSYRHVGKNYSRDAPVVTRQLQSALPVLSLKIGFAQAVTTHPDGTVTLWKFNLKRD